MWHYSVHTAHIFTRHALNALEIYTYFIKHNHSIHTNLYIWYLHLKNELMITKYKSFP